MFYHPELKSICIKVRIKRKHSTTYSQLFSHLSEARLHVSLARSEVVAHTATSSQCQMDKCRFNPLWLIDSKYDWAQPVPGNE